MSQPQSTAPLLLHGRYRIEAKLGTGRLAVVYRAFDERLQRPVLVHMLRRELVEQEPLRQRFVQEAHDSARRSHRSLLEVFDSGEIARRPYMVTEYVAGRTLRELGALSLEEALLYFRQVVGAVMTCQAAGVPHPPITSNNLVLVEDGHVELVESWQMPASEIAADIACYRAPERTEGQQATFASAVYSLGLLLYEMLAGRRLVGGDDPRSIAQAHLSARIPPLAEIRPTLHVPMLEQLLQRATARRPEDRIPDAATLAHELDQVWRYLNSDTRKLAAPPVQPPSLRRRLNHRASELVQPRPQLVPVAPPDDDLLDESVPDYQQLGSARRSFTGIITLLVLFLVVGCGAYYLTSLAVDRLLNIQLPQPEISLPEVSGPNIELPEWLTGVVSGGGEVLIVTSDLNLRDAPGVNNTNVLTVLPSGERVRKIGGPQAADDGAQWLQVRASIDGKIYEGWVSSIYVKSEAGGNPLTSP